MSYQGQAIYSNGIGKLALADSAVIQAVFIGFVLFTPFTMTIKLVISMIAVASWCVFYWRLYARLPNQCLLYYHGEWQVVKDEQAVLDVTLLETSQIFPHFVLINFKASQKIGRLVIWRDTVGEVGFRQLCRLLNYSLNRSR